MPVLLLFHFRDEETEVQKTLVHCQGHTDDKPQSQNWTPGLLVPKCYALSTVSTFIVDKSMGRERKSQLESWPLGYSSWCPTRGLNQGVVSGRLS